MHPKYLFCLKIANSRRMKENSSQREGQDRKGSALHTFNNSPPKTGRATRFNNFLEPKSVKVKPGAVLVERQAQGSLCLKGRVASLFTQPNIQLPFSLPWLGLSSLCPGLLPAGLNQQGSVGTLSQPLSVNLTQAFCPLVNGERALRF